MKVALIHDWLIHMRGGEKVLEALSELYPDATIYTLFYDRRFISPVLQKMKIKGSFLHYLPGIRMCYRFLLPILPWIVGLFHLDEDTDLVISSSHCVAKGIPVPKKAHHICYVHTPMRYIWGHWDAYFGKVPAFFHPLLKRVLAGMRDWDKRTNASVRQFIANSENVRQKIKLFYEREAEVIHPPVDAHYFSVEAQPRDYYLVVSAFVPYKRIDLVIEAFNSLDRKLMIVGAGPMESSYKNLRQSSQIFFLGTVTDSELRDLYAHARALIFPTDEDFGIVPVEAQACGTPVLAYAKGGALESVHTGIFFTEQTAEAVRQAVLQFEKTTFDRSKIPLKVADFDKNGFKQKISTIIRQSLSGSMEYVSA